MAVCNCIQQSIKYINMKAIEREDNSEGNLTRLLVAKEITMKSYFFRQGAEAMGIATYRLTDK